MRVTAIITTAAALSLAGAALAQTMTPANGETAAAGDEARALIKEFATTLQGELKAALTEGGPPAAVKVCEQEAPAIAKALAERSGWEVGRTSLKTRNPANAPDAWEQEVLVQFEDRKAAGQPVKGMSYATVVDQDGVKTYRYMMAIPTAEVCVACHGSDLSPELAETLDKLYPQDQARGYEPGDIRGAFTLSRPL